MIALIFGSSGQDGILLKKLLNKKNIKVYTSSRYSGDFPGNISDYDFVFSIIKKFHPIISSILQQFQKYLMNLLWTTLRQSQMVL